MVLVSSFIISPIEAESNVEQNEDISVNYLVSEAIGIHQDSHFDLFGFPGNGTESNPYIIENLKIITVAGSGIYIGDTTKHFIVRNCYIDAYYYGINIFNCASGTATLFNNTCNSIKGGTGIQATFCLNVTITDNICENDYYGINIESCENSTISNNECGFNTAPLSLIYSHGSYLFNNTCDYSKATGLYLNYCDNTIIANNTLHEIGANYGTADTGIIVEYSDNVTMKHNVISDCEIGIHLFAVTGSLLTDNVIMRCSSYGVYSSWFALDWPSANNTFHHNYFIANSYYYGYWSQPTSQASDSGQNSMWYDVNTNVGNYWSNYTGVGVYFIDGGVYYYDPYPMEVVDSDLDGLDDMQEIYAYFTNPYKNDTDGDMLLDGEEVKIYFTDPLRIDTDYDGLTDGEEVLIYGTEPDTQDTDHDELKDGEEIFVYGTHPRLADTDGDKMPDGWEVMNGLDPLVMNADEDPDDDGLLNKDELEERTEPLNPDSDEDFLIDGLEVYIYHTSPLNNDTDGDGAKDGIEVHEYGCDPLDKDTDDDGLWDGKEINNHFTSPTDKDSDDDGMDDGWEVKYQFDPLDDADADGDPDDDGLTNAEEFFYGTHPKYWDTDEDGFSDGHEVRVGTNPLLITDHPMAREDVIRMGVGIGLASAGVIGVVIYILFKKKIIRFRK